MTQHKKGKGLISDLAGTVAKASIGPIASAIARKIAKKIEPSGAGTKLAGKQRGGRRPRMRTTKKVMN